MLQKPLNPTLLLIFAASLILPLARSLAATAPSTPNILIIYADDMGFGDLNCQNPDSKIPIVAVTADAMTESRDNCMRDGFTGWLTKPFRIEQIKSLVDDIVTRKQTLEGKQRATSPSAC